MKQTITELAGFLILALAVTFTSCSDEGNGVGPDPDPEPPTQEVPAMYQELPGTLITQNTTWSSDTTIAGPHFVLPGVTLTIEPGVTVSFEYHNGNPSNVGTIITLPADDENFDEPRPSAKLIAEGTAQNPIVFTSARSNPQINDWGGIILIGDAPTNIPAGSDNPGGTGNVEGLPSAIEYGGDNNTDNSGILSYVRIEYSGFSIAEGSEIQGLSLYSVGSGTTLNHINIYKGSDDGIEIFGGTVDLKYVVVYGVADDSYDFDEGWVGRAQFLLGVQTPGADNGFENDGCAGDPSQCSGGNGPTSPQIYNVTLVGTDGKSEEKSYGLDLRENLQGSYNNIIITGFAGGAFLLEGADDPADPTYENYPDKLSLKEFLIFNNGNWSGERYSANYEQTKPMFKSPASYNFALQSGSPAMNAGVAPPNNGFFKQVDYIGAFGSTDWTQQGNWVRWPN